MNTVGVDLVAMSVNDIIVQGATPLFMLDYLATGKLDVEKSVKLIEGIVAGCKEAECALIGGETAEMPDFYPEGEYDLAGFVVGIEKDQIIDGSSVQAGHQLIGIGSSGLHSNGYSGPEDYFRRIEDVGPRPCGGVRPHGCRRTP